MPVNLYGPNYIFNPQVTRAIPLFIKKILKAKSKNEKEVKFGGSPDALREFLYVEDCARAIILAMELYNKSEAVNIGSGKEVSIRVLAEKIKELVGFEGEIVWENPTIDNYRCNLDVSKAEREFGFKAETSLEEGLKKTIDWHIQNYGID